MGKFEYRGMPTHCIRIKCLIMSRLSQIIAFINAEKIPTEEEMRYHYDSISKTEELKAYRRSYRGEVKKTKGKPPITEHFTIASGEVAEAIKLNNKLADEKNKT